jgi:hypothetical protein
LSTTGSIHAGSLRAFHFVEQVQRAAAAVGKDLGYFLRLNDLAPLKFGNSDDAAGRFPGAGIAGDICGDDGQTILDRLQEEVQVIYKQTGWKPPQVIIVSEIYRSEGFINALDAALGKRDLIVERLSEFKKSPVSVHSPICPRCRRVRSSQPLGLNADEVQWECGACHAKFDFSPGRSLGLVTFKLEQALMWKFCSSVVDAHGQDHIEAFDASCELMDALSLGISPLPARFNLVFNQHGEKLSKSRRNFTPIVELPVDDLEELITTYEKTPYWRPIIRQEDV